MSTRQDLSWMFSALSATNEAILRTRTEDELYQRVCEAATVGGKLLGAAAFLAGDDELLHCVAGAGRGIDVRSMMASPVDWRSDDQGLMALAYRSGRPAFTEDYVNDARLRRWHEEARKVGMGAAVAIPIRRTERISGAFLFFFGERAALSDEMARVLERMVENVSFALDGFDRENDRKKAAETTAHVNRLYAALTASNDAVLRAGTAQEMFEDVCKCVVEHGGMLGCAIFLHDEDTRAFVHAASAPSDGLMASHRFSSDPSLPEGRGLGAEAFRACEPRFSHDVRNETRSQYCRPVIDKGGANACAVFPLLSQDRPVGVMYIGFGDGFAQLDDAMVKLTGRIAENVSFALGRFEQSVQNAAMHVENQRFLAAIDNMSQGIILWDDCRKALICNRRYRDMFGLPPELSKPGSALRDILAHIAMTGVIDVNPAGYVREAIEHLVRQGHHEVVARMIDGRSIRVRNESVADSRVLTLCTDVTEQAQAEEDLRRAQQFLDAVLENAPLPIVIKEPVADDAEAEWIYAYMNRAAESLFGVSRQEWIGRPPSVTRLIDADMVNALDRQALATRNEVLSRDCPLVQSDGAVKMINTHRVAVRNESDRPIYMIGLLEDVTEQRQAANRIAYMAHHDSLTGLPNRAAFDEFFPTALAAAIESGSDLVVMSMDLDGFKEINDRYGHSSGDDVLKAIGARLHAAAADAFLARVGGDEFILLEQTAGEDGGREAARRLVEAAREELSIGGHVLRLGLSIGVAVSPMHGIDCKTLLANADLALYQAKSQQRGTVRYFSAALDSQVREERALREDLDRALENGQLLLDYQPQVNMLRETIGYEALLRWRSPDRGLVSPAKFIPVAEATGLIVPIGEWVLREACREAASWSRTKVAVNISPQQFTSGDLVKTVQRVLIETGLPPSCLELEITESVFIEDFTRALSALMRLKALGVDIALDDFGTGYSSLSYLHSFPFDRIKIDRSFIAELARNVRSEAIVRAIIGMARSLEIPILAEGVETEEQFSLLRELGCDAVQGYLTGRPQPSSAIALKARRQVMRARSA